MSQPQDLPSHDSLENVCWLPTSMIFIPGGTFLMGCNSHYDEESPAHRITVESFWKDKCEVTNEEFARFVKETDYITVPERSPKAEDYPAAKPEMLQPGSAVFRKPS